MAMTPNGQSVHVTNGNYGQPGSVSQYDVRAGGELSPQDPATVAAGVGPIAIAVSPAPVPAAKEQCRHGGWEHYGFKNLGRCIRFVKGQARLSCRTEREEIGRPALREKYGNPKHHRRPWRRCVKQTISAG